MERRALVTGLSGFSGRYVESALRDRGFSVFGLSGAGPAADNNEHDVDVDLRDRDAVIAAVSGVQPDVVIHLAAITHVMHEDINQIYETNIVGTRNLLEAIQRLPKPVDRVVVASSANVYGNTGSEVLTEEMLPQPENDYAVSKCAMEFMIRTWRSVLPIVVTRPFNYTGVGQSDKFLMPKLVSHFARREPVIELGNIDVFRDYSDVRTVADIYARLAEKGEPGEVYNICSGTCYSIEDALKVLGDVSGHRIKVEINPAFVRANEIKRLLGSREKLVAAIGDYELRGLPETLAWMYHAADNASRE